MSTLLCNHLLLVDKPLLTLLTIRQNKQIKTVNGLEKN